MSRYITQSFYKSLTPTDKKAISAVYLFRCIDLDIFHTHFYEKEGRSLDYTKRRLRKFTKEGVLEKIQYQPRNHAYFLTTIGIRLCEKMLTLPKEAFVAQGKKTAIGLYNASSLKLRPSLINHQLHLNKFVSMFKEKIDHYQVEWSYWNEKYLGKLTAIRPDGLIELSEYDLILEMDMNTEGSYRLKQKWANYRIFKRSDEFTYRERNTQTLFILGDNKNIDQQKLKAKKLIFDNLMDVISHEFDFAIGTPDELIKTCIERHQSKGSFHLESLPTLKKFLSGGLGYAVSPGFQIRQFTNDEVFDFYIRKLNSNKQVVCNDHMSFEFVVDCYSGVHMSVLKKIAYIEKISQCFSYAMNRNLKYLVIVPDERLIYCDLVNLGILGSHLVYFTTLDRLNQLVFHEALFQYDRYAGLFHFKSENLSERVFEKKI